MGDNVSDIHIRPFRPEDAAHDGKVMTWDCWGSTAEIDGKAAACGGLHRFDGKLWVFFEVTDERARRPHLLHRQALALLTAAAAHGEPIYAHRDRRQPSSGRWLLRLGFRPTGSTHLGYEVYAWQPPHRS